MIFQHYVIITISNMFNSVNIKGEEKVGGLMGYVYGDAVSSSYSKPEPKFYFNELNSIAHISGTKYCGELFGYFYSDGDSTVTGYIVTGKITVDGKWLEGAYDVGDNSGLTLADRKIYTEEDTEATE